MNVESGANANEFSRAEPKDDDTILKNLARVGGTGQTKADKEVSCALCASGGVHLVEELSGLAQRCGGEDAERGRHLAGEVQGAEPAGGGIS